MDLPGIPPIIKHSRAIVRRKRAWYLTAAIVGAISSGALLSAIPWIGPIGEVGLAAWAPIALGVASFGPEASVYLDSLAVLSAWEHHREAWAMAIVVASIETSEGDIGEWSMGMRQLEALRNRRGSSEG